MSWELKLAIASTAYAVLSEWIAFNPRLRENSLFALALRLVRLSRLVSWLNRPSVEAQTRRTMAEVDDQVRALQADWSIDYFQEQMQQAEQRRLEILKEPGVERVDLQLIGNRVALNVQYAPDPQLQTGESLALGGAMEIRSPRESHPLP